MPKDMNGREIKKLDTFCSPSDCDDLQFIGVVTEVDETIIHATLMTVSEYTNTFTTSSYHEPSEIKVLCSIEDTRQVTPAEVA